MLVALGIDDDGGSFDVGHPDGDKVAHDDVVPTGARTTVGYGDGVADEISYKRHGLISALISAGSDILSLLCQFDIGRAFVISRRFRIGGDDDQLMVVAVVGIGPVGIVIGGDWHRDDDLFS